MVVVPSNDAEGAPEEAVVVSPPAVGNSAARTRSAGVHKARARTDRERALSSPPHRSPVEPSPVESGPLAEDTQPSSCTQQVAAAPHEEEQSLGRIGKPKEKEGAESVR